MYIFYLKSHFNGPKKVLDEQDWLQFEFPKKIHFLVGHDFLCTLSSVQLRGEIISLSLYWPY